MAKMQLSKGGFEIIPEGNYIFKITKVDDTDYEMFGKLSVELQTSNGQTVKNLYSFLDDKGELKEKTLNAFSFFAKTALGNLDLDDAEIETDSLVGCYIKADVEHYSYTSKKDNKDRTIATLKNYEIAKSFEINKDTGEVVDTPAATSNDNQTESNDDDWMNE